MQKEEGDSRGRTRKTRGNRVKRKRKTAKGEASGFHKTQGRKDV